MKWGFVLSMNTPTTFFSHHCSLSTTQFKTVSLPCVTLYMPPEKYFLKTLCILCTDWLVLGYSFDKLSILNLKLVAIFDYIHLLQIYFLKKK